ncbi:uncharacterized protein LOC114944076 [Nylanderia fulva]|uniref:uncharacterized protein LOC114944076 n=1 Tax=Nylanderia fulva TaxID=613905 RepID=UPI0010FADA5C|nr:uncharacterized protein LOC114944076 [Nylanderia fulva]
MLAFAIRGIVLLGVLSWYSTTVWRMIDGYFKDQFRSYLQDEYRQHQRLRVDAENTKVVDQGPTESSLKYTEIDSDTTCPTDFIETRQQVIGTSSGTLEETVAGGTGENAAVVGATDKNAFPENAFPGQSELESRKSSSGSDEERRPSTVDENGDREKDEIEEFSASRRLEKSHRHRPGKKRLSEASKEISREKPKKRRVKTIVLTDADFASARIRNDADDDFSEFEEEEGQSVREDGILVSELPFKPKADIGDLDRVTAEEFCPLTLEDEASCGEITMLP